MSILEKRHFSRINFDAPVTIQQAQAIWQSTLADISLKGLLAERPSDWQDSKENYHIVVHLPEQEIKMEAELAHQEAQTIGFKCVSIDLDSIATLRRMVELNLGDETLLEREISAMIN